MLNRTMCDVLQAMRDCCKTGNYSYLPGLIEEVQNMGNRMEAKLYDIKDWERRENYHKKLKREIKELENKKDELSGNSGELDKD